jgi:hypothetical protein
MDEKVLPKELRAESVLKLAPTDYPVTQTNPVTGYRTSLYRYGATSDYVGWLLLMNNDQAAGYIHLRRNLQRPYLGSTRYIVMDFPPEFLTSLLHILQSKEPLQITFAQQAANQPAAAFLAHRS